MKRALPLLLLGTFGFWHAPAEAGDYFLHADVDGVVDGTDDTLYAGPGDTVEVALWVTAAFPYTIFSINMTLCHTTADMSFLDYADSLGVPWKIVPPIAYAENCELFQATDFTFYGAICPVQSGVARYAIPNGFTGGEIVISQPYGVLDDSFGDGGQIIEVYNVILLPATTATESSSWSKVKETFC